MLRAGALFYAITVALIIGLLSSSLIFYAWYNRIAFQLAADDYTAQLNAESGINLLQGQTNIVGLGGSTIYDLFGEGTDEVKLQRRPWGLYEVAVSKASSRSHTTTRVALIGTVEEGQEDRQALYLAETNRPLSLCGKTVIKGSCMLPKAGVKRAYIEGKNFVGHRLIQGTVGKSDKTVTPPYPEQLAMLGNYLRKQTTASDSLVSFMEVATRDSIVHSFEQKTLMLTEEKVVLNNYLAGNIRVVADEVFITSRAELHNVVIYATEVHIEDDFKGQVQAFATDTLIIGEECELDFPSVVGVLGIENTAQPFLQVGEKTHIDGGAFMYREITDYRHPMVMDIAKDTRIQGDVYTNELLDLKGEVLGSVTCQRFRLKTASSVYENHLLDVIIDPSERSAHFVGPVASTAGKQRKLAAWLN